MVLERFKNTAILASASMLLAVLIGVSAGVLSATHRLSVFDRAGDGARCSATACRRSGWGWC